MLSDELAARLGKAVGPLGRGIRRGGGCRVTVPVVAAAAAGGVIGAFAGGLVTAFPVAAATALNSAAASVAKTRS
jgi:hypothetical protein